MQQHKPFMASLSAAANLKAIGVLVVGKVASELRAYLAVSTQSSGLVSSGSSIS